MRNGSPPLKAYEMSFAKWVAEDPTREAPLYRIGQLVDATDDRSIAAYTVALGRYFETGDDAELLAVMPMFLSDMHEMGARSGDGAFTEGLPTPDEWAAATGTENASPTEQDTLVSSVAPGRRDGPGWGSTGYSPSEKAAESRVASGPAPTE